jgi:aryl carrier-like protein
LERLREAVAEILGVSPATIPDDADLMRLGLDSVGSLRLVNRLRRDGVPVSSRHLIGEPTLVALQLRIERAAGNQL